jgi:hypothetical protein
MKQYTFKFYYKNKLSSTKIFKAKSEEKDFDLAMGFMNDYGLDDWELVIQFKL